MPDERVAAILTLGVGQHKQVKRSGRGFRSFTNYRLRILLAGGRRQRETHPVTSIRTRRPRLVA